MKKTNRTLIMAAMLFAVISVFSGCSAAKKSGDAQNKSIVCTTFPGYDWVKNILGSNPANFTLTLLQNNGTDLHSYQPSVEDIAKISASDLFVYVGGESDGWVEKVISEAKNKNMKVINMLEALGDKVKEEEIVEGMQAEEEEEDEEEEEEIEYDEHVWLSLSNAMHLTRELSAAIQEMDDSNAATYRANTETYIKKLSDLDAAYRNAVARADYDTVLFGDRFPFRYLTDDYDLRYFAAFVGCSAESEASFETIAFLANKVDELGLPSVMTIEKSDKKIAQTIIANTSAKNQEVLEMDSLQSITQKEIDEGRNYLSAMENNLTVLKKALSAD